MLSAAAVLAVFSIVVIVHELGHFLVCRLLGVRVEKFAVGFGKELFGFNWLKTHWSICLLPLGGYVKPAGEEIEECTGAPDEFFGQSWYRRIAIAVAGPIMNYLLAMACFFMLMFFWGQLQDSNDPVIGTVIEKYPAQAAGLQEGDRLLAINGKSVASWEDVAKEIHSNPDKTIDIHFQRVIDVGVIEKVIAIVPKRDSKLGIGMIGISAKKEMIPLGFNESWKTAGQMTWGYSVLTVSVLGGALKDSIMHRKKPDLELAGPIGIVHIISKVAKKGFRDLLALLALISLSLGLFNFFPIPILDGGHAFLYLLEGILRRPLNKVIVRTAHIIGATLLIAIFIFATTQDITRLQADLWK